MVMQHSEMAKRLARTMYPGGRGQPSRTGTAPSVRDYRDAALVGRGMLSVSPADIMGLAVPGMGTVARGLSMAFGPFGVVGGPHAPAVGSQEFAAMVAAGNRARERSRAARGPSGKRGFGGKNVGGGRGGGGRGQSGQKGAESGNVGGGGDGGPGGGPGGPEGGQSGQK